MTFGQKIQQLRKDKQLSQDTLASMLYVTRQSVSLWERDKAMPSVDLLLKLSDIFDVTIDSLLGKDDSSPSPEPLASAAITTNGKQIRRALSSLYSSTISIACLCGLGICSISLTGSLVTYAALDGLKTNFDYSNVYRTLAVGILLFIIGFCFFIKRETIISKSKTSAANLTHNNEALFFNDYFTLTYSDSYPVNFYYDKLKGVFETDNYFIIKTDNGSRLCIEKNSVSSNLNTVVSLFKRCEHYRHKILARTPELTLSDRKRKLISIISNIMFILPIVCVFLLIISKTALITCPQLTAVARWIIFLLPYILCLTALLTGVIFTVKKIRAVRLIICGAVTLITALSFSLVKMPAYTFNLDRVTPEEFLTIAEKSNMSVEKTGKGRTERLLWDCYTATAEDKSFKIQYFNFIDDSESSGFVYANYLYRNLLAESGKDSYLTLLYNKTDLTFNAYYTAIIETDKQNSKKEYCYVSLNKYTIIHVLTDAENQSKVEQVFADYKLSVPF